MSGESGLSERQWMLLRVIGCRIFTIGPGRPAALRPHRVPLESLRDAYALARMGLLCKQPFSLRKFSITPAGRELLAMAAHAVAEGE